MSHRASKSGPLPTLLLIGAFKLTKATLLILVGLVRCDWCIATWPTSWRRLGSPEIRIDPRPPPARRD